MAIVLYNPQSCIEGRRRLPLPLLALGSQLPDDDYAIVDGNVLGSHARVRAVELLRRRPGRPVLAVTAMPGNQLKNAIHDTRFVRERVPELSVVWGGYFPSLHTDVVLRSELVDCVVRGQGEETFVEWLAAMRSAAPLEGIAGLSYKQAGGVRHNPDRPFASLSGFPEFAYHKLDDMEEYVIKTYLGERTLCHITSRGCPFPCNFCAITEVYQRRWLAEEPDRVARVVERFVREQRIDSIEFFDANFMAAESRALAIADQLRRFRIRWWCQARIDTMNGYSDATWQRLRESGLQMMFFGAESGSDYVLERMDKKLTSDEILECARRCRQHGIVPEFSFILGNPIDPERDVEDTIRFLYRLKRVSPECEVLTFMYTPVPQAGYLFEDATRLGFRFPSTLEEWAEERWVRFMSMKDPQTPWLPPGLRERISGFELVIKSRFPTATDIRFKQPFRALLELLSSWRWAARCFARPYELKLVHRLVRLRSPELQGFDAPPARRHRPPAQRKAFAAAAANYGQANPLLRLEREETEALLPVLAGRDVLDLGTGTGHYARLASAAGARLAVALDITPEMIRKAPKPSIVADASRLPFAAGSFDVVVAALLFSFVGELREPLCEIARVLRPGGWLVASDLHELAARKGWQRSFAGEHGERIVIDAPPPERNAVLSALAAAELTLESAVEPRIDERLRPAFEQARRRDFAALAGTPLLQIFRARRGEAHVS